MTALPLPAAAQRRGAESLPGLLAVIIAGFCFHFCCLMLLILLTIALKVVHRTLRCANNKNVERKRRCKVYRTHGHAPCRRASPLSLPLSASSRPRVLQKITKILFAAMQLLPKKNHRAKAEVGVAHSGCWLRLLFHLFHFIHTPHSTAKVAWAQRVQLPFPLKSFISHTMPGTFYRSPSSIPPPLSCSAAVVIAGMIKYEINF